MLGSRRKIRQEVNSRCWTAVGDASSQRHLCSHAQPESHTFAEVALGQRLQDGVHGSHVEDETQLCHTHGDEAQQEDGTDDALHEGLICRRERGGRD